MNPARFIAILGMGSDLVLRRAAMSAVVGLIFRAVAMTGDPDA